MANRPPKKPTLDEQRHAIAQAIREERGGKGHAQPLEAWSTEDHLNAIRKHNPPTDKE